MPRHVLGGKLIIAAIGAGGKGESDIIEFYKSGNSVIFYGTKGKMMCDTYGANARLQPLAHSKEVNVAQTIARVAGGAGGQYKQWVNACIAGYNSTTPKKLSSPFSIAEPLTKTVLMGKLAIHSNNVRVERVKEPADLITLAEA